MSSIRFIFNGVQTLIQCRKDEKLNDICNKYASKILKDKSNLQFIYGGKQINFELSFDEHANPIDKESNQMNILVYENNNTIINENNCKVKPKNIICPSCNEN